VRVATDDGGLGGLDRHQSWALILIASRPQDLQLDDLAAIFMVTISAARVRFLQPLLDRGLVIEARGGRLAPTDLGASMARPALADSLVLHEVAETLAELAWFRSES
jgi:hypothetical protein